MRLVFIKLFVFIVLTVSAQNNPIIEIHTQFGVIGLELYEDKAPKTSKNFIRYIEDYRYADATFYRVVKEDNQPNSNIKIQVIQGGLYEDDHPMFLPPIEHESTDETGIQHLDGTISMARYGPGTATFEFFICVGDQPSLNYGGGRNSDGEGFAAFGRVVYGMDVVKLIHQFPDSSQYLVPRIKIDTMVIVK